MKDPYVVITVAGILIMIIAATLFDWRIGLFVLGFVAWMDFR